MDARGIPTTKCPNCSADLFKVVVQFDPIDYEIGMYFLDAECVNCKTLVTVPTPLDHPSKKKE